jgi:hypothetical protein
MKANDSLVLWKKESFPKKKHNLEGHFHVKNEKAQKNHKCHSSSIHRYLIKPSSPLPLLLHEESE